MNHNHNPLHIRRAQLLADYFLECTRQGLFGTTDDIDYLDAMTVITSDINYIKEDLKLHESDQPHTS